MLNYVLRRLLIFIPTLILISFITFIISVNAPGDPVQDKLDKSKGSGEAQLSDKLAGEKAYRVLREQMGFNKPLFYFSITNSAYPDTLYRIYDPRHRSLLERLAFEHGSWESVNSYFQSLRHYEQFLLGNLPDGPSARQYALDKIGEVQKLFDRFETIRIDETFERIKALRGKNSIPGEEKFFSEMNASFSSLISESRPWKKYIPAFHWYGTDNQYHHWFFNFLKLDFGRSYKDDREVRDVISEALPYTLGISIISILIAYLIATPLGVFSAVKKGLMSEKITTTSLFVLYSLPNFWIATMLIIFFCGGDYFDWFPAPGAAPIPEDAPLDYKISQTIYRMALPMVCWTYPSLAFISRQMRGGMLNVISQDFIRTARAKGLTEKRVIWKHAFRNSLLPVITLFAAVFPAAISGSFVLEYIFQIPGMGKISYEALFAKNYPVIFAVMMFTATLTLIGNLVADILYAAVDPRISFGNKKA